MTEKFLSADDLLDKACRYVTLQVPFADAAAQLAEFKTYGLTLSFMRTDIEKTLNRLEDADLGDLAVYGRQDVCESLFLARNKFLMDIILRHPDHRDYNSNACQIVLPVHEQELMDNMVQDQDIAKSVLRHASVDFIHGYIRDDLKENFPRTNCQDHMSDSCLKIVGIKKSDTISDYFKQNYLLHMVYMAELGQMIEHGRYESFDTISQPALQDYFINQNNVWLQSGEETARQQKEAMPAFLANMKPRIADHPSFNYN